MAPADSFFEKALRFVQDKHQGQFRAGGMPVWQHLLRVSEVLRIVFEITKEGTQKERSLIATSALGHDLIEDTDAMREDIEKIFGVDGCELIVGMTNVKGDSDHSAYIDSMKNASEEVRLIKLSDLYDNFTSVAHNLTLLKEEWANSFFLPIVVPMHAMIKKTKFDKYKQSAELLNAMVDTAEEILRSELGHAAKTTKDIAK